MRITMKNPTKLLVTLTSEQSNSQSLPSMLTKMGHKHLLLRSIMLSLLTSGFALSTQAIAANNHDIMLTKYQPTITLPSGEQAANYCSPAIEADTRHPDRPTELQYNIDCMMTELKTYQAATQPPTIQYYAYKAQAWLNYAYHENSEGSLTQAGDYALAEGIAILQALRDNQSDQLLATSDIPPTSAMMRPDLWATLMTLKEHGGIEVSPREMAFSEVKLVWAASEYCEFGWRHAREHFNAAERWINQSRIAVLNTSSDLTANQLDKEVANLFKIYEPLDAVDNQCQGQVLPKLIVKMPLVMPDATVSYEVAEPTLLEPYFVHFALDKSELSAASKQILDELVNRLSSLPDHTSIADLKFDLYGYTDKRASQSYNLALSGRRTQAVAKYLVQKGIPAQRIAQHPEGKQSLLNEGDNAVEHALNRRVEIVLSVSTQADDVIVIDKVDTNIAADPTLHPDLQLEQ